MTPVEPTGRSASVSAAAPGGAPAPGVTRSPGPVDRVMSIFGRVQAGEGFTVLLMLLFGFVLLFAYYLVKPVREALILGGEGAEVKSYSSAAQALLLVFLIPAYGRLASHVSRIRLISWVTLFFASNLVIFFLLGRAGVERLGVPFFLWVGIFNVMVIAQFWAFANDLYTPEEGKRLFGMLAIGSSLGAIVGSWVAKPIIAGITIYGALLVAAVLLAASVGIAISVHARERDDPHGGRAAAKDEPLGKDGGFQLIARDRYLLLLALFVLLLNAVNTTGEYILGKTVAAEADRVIAAGSAGAANPDDFKDEFIGLFYADFFFWVNLIGAVLQILLVSRLISWIGVRAALFFLPLIALGGYTLLATVPALALIRGVKIAENSIDYSLNNTARHALFLPTSREAKYKAKAAIDSFFWRMGDLASAGVVWIGVQLSLGIKQVAAINVGLVLVWLTIVVLIGRKHRQLVHE